MNSFFPQNGGAWILRCWWEMEDTDERSEPWWNKAVEKEGVKGWKVQVHRTGRDVLFLCLWWEGSEINMDTARFVVMVAVMEYCLAIKANCFHFLAECKSNSSRVRMLGGESFPCDILRFGWDYFPHTQLGNNAVSSWILTLMILRWTKYQTYSFTVNFWCNFACRKESCWLTILLLKLLICNPSHSSWGLSRFRGLHWFHLPFWLQWDWENQQVLSVCV